MKKTIAIILLITTLIVPFYATAQRDSLSITPQQIDSSGHRNFFTSTWQWFSRWREKAQTSGFDSGYVSYPKGHPWMVKAYSKMSLTYQAVQ